MRLYRRGATWWVDVTPRGLPRQRLSTHCTDKRAAEAEARRIERDLAEGRNSDSVSSATLEDALVLLIEKRTEQAALGKRSVHTVSMYRKKSGHLLRLLGSRLGEGAALLAELTSGDVDAYITARRREGASGNTITKEIVTLRGALKLAARAGIWHGNLLALLPEDSIADYRPRTRWLTTDEVDALMKFFSGGKAARIAFIVATSANRGEAERARREDISIERDFVSIRGTKRAWRARVVPVVDPTSRLYLDFAIEHADGKDGMLFAPWSNMNRDLIQACARLGFERCSPNDLRRTCATWLRAKGLPPDLIASVLGHRDTRMVERVYGRLPPELLAQRMRAVFGANGAPAALRPSADDPTIGDAEKAHWRKQ